MSSARWRVARWWGPAIVLTVAAGIGVAPLIPPTGGAGGGSGFSSTRVLEDIERIAVAPRPIGSMGNRAARELLISELEEIGLTAETQEVPATDYYGGSPDPVVVVNVLARIPGTASTGAVVIVGHYDTVPDTPGANDDASAVAILLEIARNIVAAEPLRNDVLLLFTDGEEPAPRFGSEAFVAAHPWAADVAFVINLEALGMGGPSMLVNVNGPTGFAIEAYGASVTDPVAFSYITATARLIGGSNTDIAPFGARGIPGLELAYLHGSSIYHTPDDNLAALNPHTLQQQGAAALAIASHVAKLDLSAPETGTDRAFFTLAGRWLVGYPAWWNLPIVILACILAAIGVWRRRAWRGLLASVATTLVSLVLAATLALAAWSTIARARPGIGIAEAYLYLGILILMVGVIGLTVGMVGRRLAAPRQDAGGVVIVWGLMGTLGTLAAPELAYPLVLPALVAALLLLVPRERAHVWSSAARPSIAGAVALVLLIPPIDTFFQLAQPRPGNPDSELIPIIVIPVALLVLLFELVHAMWTPRSTEPEQGG